MQYVLDELEWFAARRTAVSVPGGAVQSTSTSINHAPCVVIEDAAVYGTYQSDGLVEADLRAALVRGVAPLEAAPPDYHPGSNQQANTAGALCQVSDTEAHVMLCR